MASMVECNCREIDEERSLAIDYLQMVMAMAVVDQLIRMLTLRFRIVVLLLVMYLCSVEKPLESMMALLVIDDVR